MASVVEETQGMGAREKPKLDIWPTIVPYTAQASHQDPAIRILSVFQKLNRKIISSFSHVAFVSY